MIVTLAGHVDHGKTAIVKALTGVDTDRLDEEKRRGLTIDLGFAYRILGGQRIGFVDVPGHHRFIHNMIAGVASMQHALLVIAADDGVMPQTREHLNILTLLGLRHGTVVVNKVDSADPETIPLVKEEIRDVTSNTFLSDSPIVETSAITGQGIERLREILNGQAQKFQEIRRPRATRIAIDRSFSPRGIGAVVTGTVYDGEVCIGDELQLTDTSRRVRVRSIVTDGIESESGSAGNRCGLQISGESASNIVRGTWLREPASVFDSRELSLDFKVLADFPRTVKHWSPVHIYHATDHCQGRILPLSNPLQPGSQGIVDIVCDEPMQIAVGDRLLVRDHDLQRTLGGGVVLTTQFSETRRRHPKRLDMLEKIRPIVVEDDEIGVFRQMCESTCVSLEEFRRMWNLDRAKTEEIAQDPNQRQLRGTYLATKAYEEILGTLKRILTQYHQERPSGRGLSLSNLIRLSKQSPRTIEFCLRCAAEDNEIVSRFGGYVLATYRAPSPDYDKNLYEKIRPLIDTAQPLTTGDVAKSLRIPLRQIETEMRKMAAASVFVAVTPRRYFTMERLLELANVVLKIGCETPFSAKEIRDISGMGRMVIIDVLEYFDRCKFTQRNENFRTVIGTPEQILRR